MVFRNSVTYNSNNFSLRGLLLVLDKTAQTPLDIKSFTPFRRFGYNFYCVVHLPVLRKSHNNFRYFLGT